MNQTIPLQNDPQSFKFSLKNVLTIIWFLGIIGFAIYSVKGNIKLFKRMKGKCPVPNREILNLFNHCKKKMNISSSISVYEVEGLKIPLLCGCLNPRILLPANISKSLSQNELEHIFLHELAHHKRHDVAVAWVTAILQIFHWFNPVIWYAFFRIRADRELACDESILASIGASKSQTYGRTIISLLEHISVKKCLPVTVGILETRKELKQRLTMIAHFKKRSYVWSLLAMVLLISLGGFSLTEAQKSTEKIKPNVECTEYQNSESQCTLNSTNTTQSRTSESSQNGEECNLRK